VDHLTAIPYFVNHFREKLDLDNAVVVATDAGGAKRAGRFASRIHLPMAIIDKRRVADTEVVQGLVVGDVKGRDAIIFEDEISTGGTLVASVATLAAAGAKRILAGATHGVLCGPAVNRLIDSAIESVVVTDTVHLPEDKRVDKIITLSVAPLFFPVAMQLLGLITGVIQAYIFAILAAVYIAAAVKVQQVREDAEPLPEGGIHG